MKPSIQAAVIGHPVSHSKSPLIHNYWIEKYGCTGSYEAVDVAPENFKEKIRALVDEGYAGFNLTVPHKEAALALCDETDTVARAVGAVNTVTVRNGKLIGTNTDVFGFVENIRNTQPEFDFTAGTAVVLGAGGAARAAVYGLLKQGTPAIRLVNRTREKAEILRDACAQPEKIEIVEWADRTSALAGVHFLTNTTVLGMNGKPALDLDLTNLPDTAVVNDIVYAPLETVLLKNAATRGNPVVGGIGMLLHQARPAFQAWFGILPEVDEALERRVLS